MTMPTPKRPPPTTPKPASPPRQINENRVRVPRSDSGDFPLKDTPEKWKMPPPPKKRPPA